MEPPEELAWVPEGEELVWLASGLLQSQRLQPEEPPLLLLVEAETKAVDAEHMGPPWETLREVQLEGVGVVGVVAWERPELPGAPRRGQQGEVGAAEALAP